MSTPENLPTVKEVPVTDETYEKPLKILLLGDSSVGKSSLFLSFMDKSWNETFVPTIGVDFKIKTINVNNMNIKYQVWDTAGQERFRTIISSYYKGAHGILLVYDITLKESFESLNDWLNEIKKNTSKNIVKVLIGNKIHINDKRVISFDEAKEFADNNSMKYIETSAKTSTNVDQAFGLIGVELMKSFKGNEEKNTNKKNVVLSNSEAVTDNKQIKKGCCKK